MGFPPKKAKAPKPSRTGVNNSMAPDIDDFGKDTHDNGREKN